MLLDMAVGDAYGVAFEFANITNDRPNTVDRYYRHYKYQDLGDGKYTDDTQRAIANAEVVLSGDYLNANAYAEAYVRVYKRDPRSGYSSRYGKFLASMSTGEEFLTSISRTAISNGSLMGVAPLGYIKDPNHVALAASIQAMVTHSHRTVPYAQTIALAAHYFIYGHGDISDLIPWVNQFTSETLYWYPVTARVSMDADITASAIIHAIRNHGNMHDMLKWCVDIGGDTDSVASGAMALASLCDEIENNLDPALYDGLENGPYGKEFLKQMDQALESYAGRI